MKQTCIKRKTTVIMSFTLLILVLSKNTLVIFVKTKPEHGKWRKHDTRGSMESVQSLAVVRLRIVHDNCDFTERSLV